MDAYLESLGLSIYLNFINAEEEQELIKNIPSASKNIKKTKARNNIFRYGSELPYKSNIISQEIPNCFCFLLEISKIEVKYLNPNNTNKNKNTKTILQDKQHHQHCNLNP